MPLTGEIPPPLPTETLIPGISGILLTGISETGEMVITQILGTVLVPIRAAMGKQ
jgi:hypothetical protein